ncbi:MAG TPA: sugar phosphate isomerase/epimerase family protein [Ferruginibacter sp.]|nr:sugar phosphate isomerase/epimerase family protein [Ferruginibacter sp.]
MPRSTRRTFLQTTSLLSAAALMGLSFTEKRPAPLLSFSTLGCPDWDLKTIIDFAAKHGYDGIELRGIQRELDLTKCKSFQTAAARRETLQQAKDAGVKFINLGSSCTLHFAAGVERGKNIDEGKRFIDLANDIECPFIRVFPNNFLKENGKERSMELISKGLLELAEYAKGAGVKVLIESHGDLVYIDDLEKIMIAAAHENTGMIWDISNMWTITKEPPAAAYARLKKYIYHAHIKDAKLMDGKLQYVFLGKGDVPIMQAVDILAKDNYTGYYSFEWEKLWHPEIGEPEMALADYMNVMKEHFKA